MFFFFHFRAKLCENSIYWSFSNAILIPIIFIFTKMILFVALAFQGLFFLCCFGQARPNQVGWDQIGALTQCHEQFLRTGPLKPDGSRGYYSVDPYYEIETSIKHCLRENKESFKLHEHLFRASGFSAWLKEKKSWLNEQFRFCKRKQKTDEKKRNECKEDWRKKLTSIGLALKSMLYQIGEHLIGRLIDINLEAGLTRRLNMERYKYMLNHFAFSVTNIDYMLRMRGSFAQIPDLFDYTGFNAICEKIQQQLYAIEMMGQFPENLKVFWWKSENSAPKVRRILWIVRHAERLDNVDAGYKRRTDENGQPIEHKVAPEFNGRGQLYDLERPFFWDNCPLSPRGKLDQAPHLEPVFAKIPVSHVFASPMQRTVDTARILLGNSHGQGQTEEGEAYEQLQIKLEAGVLERLDCCMAEPSFSGCEELQKIYGRLDCGYQSLFVRNTEEAAEREEGEFFLLDSEREGATSDEDDCVPRVKRTLEHIVLNFDKANGYKGALSKRGTVNAGWIAPGEEQAVHIVIVSHGAPIGASHQLMGGQWGNIAQASISKFVEFEEPIEPKGQTYLDGKKSVLDNFRLIYTSETRHFGEQRKDLVFPY